MATYRNRALLNIAHQMPCTATFKHICKAYEGVEPAHADSLMFGRGVGHKTPDWAWISVCHAAHLMLDTFEREQKFNEWLRAFVSTQNYLWENGLICVTPKK